MRTHKAVWCELRLQRIGPGPQRARVMRPQVFRVEHFQAALGQVLQHMVDGDQVVVAADRHAVLDEAQMHRQRQPFAGVLRAREPSMARKRSVPSVSGCG